MPMELTLKYTKTNDRVIHLSEVDVDPFLFIFMDQLGYVYYSRLAGFLIHLNSY